MTIKLSPNPYMMNFFTQLSTSFELKNHGTYTNTQINSSKTQFQLGRLFQSTIPMLTSFRLIKLKKKKKEADELNVYIGIAMRVCFNL